MYALRCSSCQNYDLLLKLFMWLLPILCAYVSMLLFLPDKGANGTGFEGWGYSPPVKRNVEGL